MVVRLVFGCDPHNRLMFRERLGLEAFEGPLEVMDYAIHSGFQAQREFVGVRSGEKFKLAAAECSRDDTVSQGRGDHLLGEAIEGLSLA